MILLAQLFYETLCRSFVRILVYPNRDRRTASGRREIDEAVQFGDLSSGTGDALGPARDEGQMICDVVVVAFATGKRHAVVRGHHDQRVGSLAAFLERLQLFSDLRVESFNLARSREPTCRGEQRRCPARRRGRAQCPPVFCPP